jgi:LysR family transcriptional regulator, nod-box dependent transcriptional activator
MRFNKLDLNQLVVLDALLTERGVSAAAKRLDLSQPAASCALRRLRDHFDDDLLVQVGKAMVLTPLAQTLVQPLRDVRLRLQAFGVVHAGFDAKTAQRTLKVEASDYVIEVLLTEVVRHCWSEAPHVRIEVSQLGTHTGERLEQGDIDLVVCPAFRAMRSQPSELLFQDTLSCVVWNKNTEVGSQLSEAQYHQLGHVAAYRGAPEDGRLKDRRRCEVTVPGFTLVPQFVVGSPRIALLQTRLAVAAARSLPLRVLPCPVDLPLVEVVAQWHKYRDEDPLLSWIRALFRRVVQQMPAVPA